MKRVSKPYALVDVEREINEKKDAEQQRDRRVLFKLQFVFLHQVDRFFFLELSNQRFHCECKSKFPS